MALNLTIDQGNTTTKLALWDESGSLVDLSTRHRLVARDVEHIAKGHEIDTAIYCTVTHRTPAIMHALGRRATKAIEMNVHTPTPLTVEYGTPGTLGLDRLAAAVGAYSLPTCKGREILVADLGTAITVDRVTYDGRFPGGNISPGIVTRLKALHHYTARLPMVDVRNSGQPIPVFGNNTRSALLAGAVRGVVAELEYYYKAIGCDKGIVAVLTGGDAGLVAPLLSFEPIIEPNLVSIGLRNIIEYNR